MSTPLTTDHFIGVARDYMEGSGEFPNSTGYSIDALRMAGLRAYFAAKEAGKPHEGATEFQKAVQIEVQLVANKESWTDSPKNELAGLRL